MPHHSGSSVLVFLLCFADCAVVEGAFSSMVSVSACFLFAGTPEGSRLWLWVDRAPEEEEVFFSGFLLTTTPLSVFFCFLGGLVTALEDDPPPDAAGGA